MYKVILLGSYGITINIIYLFLMHILMLCILSMITSFVKSYHSPSYSFALPKGRFIWGNMLTYGLLALFLYGIKIELNLIGELLFSILFIIMVLWLCKMNEAFSRVTFVIGQIILVIGLSIFYLLKS